MYWIDMDGVMADFNAGLEDLYGVSAYEALHNPVLHDQFFEVDCLRYDVYSRLKPIDAFMNDVLPFIPEPRCVLTSTGSGPWHYLIAKQKMQWLFTHTRCIIPAAMCGSQTKNDFAQSKYDILIDDRLEICQPFEDAGGTALHWTGDSRHMLQLIEDCQDEYFVTLKTQGIRSEG